MHFSQDLLHFSSFSDSLSRMNRSGRLASPLIAARIESGLAHRSWTIAGTAGPAVCHVFFVSQGEAKLSGWSDMEDMTLDGPCLVWLPRALSGVFRLAAGSEGSSCTVAEAFAARIAADSPLAAHLTPLLTRFVILSGAEIAPLLEELSVSFCALMRETADQRPGAEAVVAVHLNLLLLHLWRGSGLTGASGRQGGAGSTVQRFRQLIELHYRQNLTVDAFARLLGVTRPHLHDACLRGTGRTPLALIHDRIIGEAKLRLEQTELLVEQVAYSLGFREPAYFNRFFKRVTGQSPGAYRRTCRSARSAVTAESFAAWP
jgi:AraC family transcriptional activator of pobA